MKFYLNSLLNIKLWILLSAIDITFIGHWFEKYVFGDMGYLEWLMIAMFIDLLTGVTKVWVNEGLTKVTSRGLRDTISKCIQYGSFLIITHVLTHFEINGQALNKSFDWVNKVAYEYLILIETKSVYENIVKINPKLDFIKFLTSKLFKLFKEEK